ncbi:hypothetical protein G7Z17_g8026 [Cylindrodendrum hubeiense]|uniref:Uncharacterized protein n=1 Tax=Cylindrodendrum hubeiense TaxID=595255 RepID=A0A9P5L6W4_9HYPO|nr:hypothetical protein G7Z17_g8026 [Cylindrodendrum hubeiense]
MTEPIDTGLYFTSRLHHDTYPAIDPRQRDFTGKYIFITGASQGIAEAAAAAGKPAPIVVAVTLDVTDEASVEAAAKKVDKSFPRLDVLVNNAGYLEKRAKIIDSDPAEWWKTWTVNVKGPYLVTRAFLPQILEKGGDKIIVNLSSMAAHLRSPGGSAYQTSKLALQRFTEFLDADHGSDGVLTFAIHPGGVPTNMGLRLPKERQAILTETPQLPADTIVFLTEKRREWLAARYLSATWDVEELLSKEEEITKGDKLKVRMVI